MIPPALTGEQWAYVAAAGGAREYEECVAASTAGCAYLIAANNAALPDDDPRKITHSRVELLREAADHAEDLALVQSDEDYIGTLVHEAQHLRELADALASYLAPRT